jgi:predicted metal-dependent hydrolase
MYTESDYFQLKCIIADSNSKKYCIREREKLKEASNLLAEISDRLETLVKNMYRDSPNEQLIKRIHQRFDSQKIKEILPTSEYTAYSENKGEKLALCLNEVKENANSKLIDPNTLMYVAMHELTHIGTVSIGHGKEFWTNFKTIIEYAVKYNLYKPVNYKEQNKLYCGMNLTDNPYFDGIINN